MNERIANDGFIEVQCPSCKQWHADWFPHVCRPVRPLTDPRIENAQRFLDIYARRAADPTVRFSRLRNVEGVYVVHDPSKPRLHKIGRSEHIQWRIRALNTELKTWLAIDHLILTPYHLEVEKECHKLFARKRRHGEWFYLTPRDLEILMQHFSQVTP